MSLNDSENTLLNNLKDLVATERRITQQIIEKLVEVDKTMLYAKMGYSSLFDFCTKELRLSEGAANRRISAMRLLRQVPTIKNKLEMNEINISTLTQLKSFITRVEKADGHKLTTSEKTNLIEIISNKNQRECEQTLIALRPLEYINRETQRRVDAATVEVKFYMNLSLQKKLERTRELLSHVNHKMEYADLFDRLLEDFLKRNDPMRRNQIKNAL